MRVFSRVPLFLLVSFLAFGCGGSKAGIEGKVVDANAQPMPNVKVIARQIPQIKGYEDFETTTGPNGVFKFKGLFPKSDYDLFVQSDKGMPLNELKGVKSGPEGETSMLASPITMPFAVSNDKVIDDAGIEGKVVDAKGQPISNIKVNAKQAQPVKGYEDFETTTGPDGVFKFNGLYPASEYAVVARSDKGIPLNEANWIQSGAEGETSLMTWPIIVRFMFVNDGIIEDTERELQWAPAPDQTMNWFHARDYIKNLSLGGGGWRLPKSAELKSIHNKSLPYGANSFFNIGTNVVWMSESQNFYGQLAVRSRTR